MSLTYRDECGNESFFEEDMGFDHQSTQLCREGGESEDQDEEEGESLMSESQS